MKTNKIIFKTFAISSLFLVAACGNSSNKDTIENNEKHDTVSHIQHESLQQNFAHKDIIILKNPNLLEEENENKLKEVIKAYLAMKNAFIVADSKRIDSAAQAMLEHVKSVDPKNINGDGKEAWLQHASGYESKLTELLHIKGLEERRSYFSHLSEIVYCTIKSFKLNDMKLYAVYCPKAFDGKGAYWISETEEIRNPYSGEKMKDCGSIKEEL